ncbi:MAG: glycosyltransferase family 4 protein [Candidatus Omnitrophota bacterium]
MNILILTTHLNPGGVSRYVINLAGALKQKGHQVWVASSSGVWIDKLKSLGVNHKIIPIKTKSIVSIKILFSLIQLFPFLLRHNISIVHCNTRVTQALGFFIHSCLRIPYISAFHGFYRPSIFRKIFQFSGSKAITVSKAVKKHIIEDLGVDGDKTRVVYNGIDKEEFTLRGNNRDRGGFKESDYLIGILGRISEEKGHFLAVEAIAALIPSRAQAGASGLSRGYKDIYLLISGTGKMEEKLKLFVETKGLKSRVKFVNREADNFLDSIDLLIVPSRKEGFGYSIVEAFFKEVPVVGFNTGGISEIIKNCQNGVLFNEYNSFSLAKAIEKVFLDKELKEKIIVNAKKDVSRWTAQRMAEDTLSVYNEALKRNA